MKPRSRGKDQMILVAAQHLQGVIETAVIGNYQALVHAGWSEEDRALIAMMAMQSCVRSRIEEAAKK